MILVEENEFGAVHKIYSPTGVYLGETFRAVNRASKLRLVEETASILPIDSSDDLGQVILQGEETTLR